MGEARRAGHEGRRQTGFMRQAFAHEAALVMAPDGDIGAPGAAVTVALCGHWDHEPPCPLAPHHTQADRIGDRVHLRTVFAVEPGGEDEVRQRIDAALTGGKLEGPAGVTTHWELRDSQPSAVSTADKDLAARLSQPNDS
jgi:hypothetical protein